MCRFAPFPGRPIDRPLLFGALEPADDGVDWPLGARGGRAGLLLLPPTGGNGTSLDIGREDGAVPRETGRSETDGILSGGVGGGRGVLADPLGEAVAEEGRCGEEAGLAPAAAKGVEAVSRFETGATEKSSSGICGGSGSTNSAVVWPSVTWIEEISFCKSDVAFFASTFPVMSFAFAWIRGKKTCCVVNHICCHGSEWHSETESSSATDAVMAPTPATLRKTNTFPGSWPVGG